MKQSPGSTDLTATLAPRHVLRISVLLITAGFLVGCSPASDDVTEGEPSTDTTTSSLPARMTRPGTTPPSTPTSTPTSAPVPVPTPGSEPSPTTIAAPAPGECVADLGLEEVAALVVWPAAEPESWSDVVDAVTEHDVGGVVLFEPDSWDASELAARLDELESMSRHGLVIATDEEGGVVQRLDLLGDLPSQRDVGGGTALERLDDVRSTISAHGALVRATGVDVVFGPVVDVVPESGDVPLAPSRFFPGGPDDVAALADAYVQGWNDADLIATLKHFPGHGAATADTHDTAATTPSIDALRARDLVPYRLLGDRVANGEALVMVGHLTVPGLTGDAPATRSPEAVELLRSIPGYDDAVLVTDALGMGAVGLAEPEASVAALTAGLDVVIFTRTGQTGAVVEAIVAAVKSGELSDESLRESAARVMRLLERDGHTCR